jgi:MOSC domain-containing protein YiiM
VFEIIGRWFGGQSGPAVLTAIFIAERAGLPMVRAQTAVAVMSRGLEGDRYYLKTGYWDPVEGCQVTLISEHDLERAGRGHSLDFSQGSHRLNLVVNGLKTKRLEGKTFQIGEAIFAYDKPRPPCGYLNQIEGRGMAKALSYNSGVCLQVKQSGAFSVGDEVVIL